MNEETISKVLTGETDISTMSHADFVELLKCLGRMYFARVMNCVDGTGKSDKEWTALASIFNRVVETISEKPRGDCAKLREALGKLRAELWNNTVIAGKRKFELYEIADAALAAPPRNCDKYTTVKDAAIAFAKAKNNLPHPIPDFIFSAWLLDTTTESEVAK